MDVHDPPVASLLHHHPALIVRHNLNAVRKRRADKHGVARNRGIAVALANLATISGEMGQFSAARAQFAESLAMFRALGDEQNIAMSLHSIGYFAYQEGDYATV